MGERRIKNGRSLTVVEKTAIGRKDINGYNYSCYSECVIILRKDKLLQINQEVGSFVFTPIL